MSETPIRPWRAITRRKTRQIMVGNVPIGGDAPISVQSMTNTLTTDIKGTIEQIQKMEAVGVDIVRCSCPDEESSIALKEIIKEINVPVIADIHFHYKRGIEAAEAGAACLRINPGNIGSSDRVAEIVKAAKDNNCSMRIGVNAGSLDNSLLKKYGEPCPEAMVESAMAHAKLLEDHDFREFKISVKSSDVMLSMAAYRGLSAACDYPLHVGVTEAGGLRTGTVKSAVGMGVLLGEGIGDTIRVSLSADVQEEVRVGFEILKSLGLRSRGISIVSCPTCARQGINVIKTVEVLEERLAHILTPVTLSILGCVVNGPGEAQHTDIGVTGGGDGAAQIYIKGKSDHRFKDGDLIEHIVELVEARAAEMEAEKELKE